MNKLMYPLTMTFGDILNVHAVRKYGLRWDELEEGQKSKVLITAWRIIRKEKESKDNG